jgi:hypothetical protein
LFCDRTIKNQRNKTARPKRTTASKNRCTCDLFNVTRDLETSGLVAPYSEEVPLGLCLEFMNSLVPFLFMANYGKCGQNYCLLAELPVLFRVIVLNRKNVFADFLWRRWRPQEGAICHTCYHSYSV